MSLKKTILAIMSRDDLKAIVDAAGLEQVDRRSVQPMRDALSRSRRIRPKMLLNALTEGQVKVVCERVGIDPKGRKNELIRRLLGGKSQPAEEPQRKATPTTSPRTHKERLIERRRPRSA